MTIQTNNVQVSKAGIVVDYTDNSGAAVQQTLSFANKTLSVNSGFNVVSGDSSLAGALNVTGITNLNNALNVSAASALGSSLAVTGVSNMNNTVNVAGVSNLNNALNVSGAAALGGSLAVTGAANLNNALNVSGASALGGSLAIAGVSNMNNALNVSGAAALSGSLAVTGAVNLSNTLDVTGAARLRSTLLQDGAATLGNTLTVTGATVLNNNTTINGTSALNGALTVSGASSLGGALNVTGAVNLSSTLDVTGAAHLLNTVIVDQAATLGSSLAVAGASNLNGVLNVVGASHLSSTLLADGAATLGSSLAVAGAANMSDVLNVTGASHLSSSLLADGAATLGSSLAVAGASNMNGVLNVVGASHLSSTLLADGAATLGSSLAVAGASNLNGVMNVAGASALGSTLAVTGAANLNNTLAVAGATTVGGAFALSGAASFNNTLGVAGNATFQQNVTVNGNMTVLGNQTAIDTTSLQVKDNAILIADNNVTDTLQSGVMVQYKPIGASAPKYAGVKRRPVAGNAGGEFVFFKDADSQISLDGSSNSSSSVSSSVYSVGSNAAAISQTPVIYLPCDAVPANGSTSQGTNPSTLTVVGSPTLVQGVVGANALNFVNTLGSTSNSQYIRGPISLMSNFTISFWFNVQSMNASNYQNIFAMFNMGICIYINPSNQVAITIPSGGGTNAINLGTSSISTNTWYNVTVIFQTGGLCSFYLNNTLIASSTNSGGTGTLTSSNFTLAWSDTSGDSNTFNGYIDDFKIYNVAVPLVAQPQTPYIHLPFNNSLTDIMGNSTVTMVNGSMVYSTGIVGSYCADFSSNTSSNAPSIYCTVPMITASNFTISGWFKALSFAGTDLPHIFAAYGGAVKLYFNNNGTIALTIPSGGGYSIVTITSSALLLNTWYNFTCIFQTNGRCSLYLNNALIGSIQNTGGVGGFGPNVVSIGAGNNVGFAFSGYLDDFKIYNSAITFSPLDYSYKAVSSDGKYALVAPALGGYPYISVDSGVTYANVNPNTPYAHFKFENNLMDTMGNITLTATGSPGYIKGIVGTNAINLANTTAAPTQYIRGSISNYSNFSISFWFNLQSIVSSSANMLISMGSTGGSPFFTVYYLSGTGLVVESNIGTISTGTAISLNTWYNITVIHSSSGTCYSYLNNILLGTIAGGAITGVTTFGIGVYAHVTSAGAINGYIDDFKIYNSAIAFNPMVPMNYSYVGMSSNGQYMLAAATNGGLFMSSDKGSSWAQVTGVTSNGLWSGLSLSSTGQTMIATQNPRTGIMPQLTGLPSSGTALTTSQWKVNEVTWIASASSIYHSTFPVSSAFGTNSTWVSGSLYNAGTSGASGGNYTGSTSTSIVGSSALLGEVLTIQSSIPLVMNSYAFSTAGWFQYPRIYAIVGSNDGTNWYLVQSVTMANGSGSSGGPGGATNYSAPTSYITVNQSGSQTVTTTTGSASITTTSYSSSTNAYTYFRISTQNVFYTGGGASQVGFDEWLINFTSGGQSYSTNYGSTWTTAYNAPISVAPSLSGNGQYLLAASGAVTNTNMPNLTGLAANTWTTNGVNWTASTSTLLSPGSHPAYAAFNNYYGSAYPFSWAGIAGQYNGANNTYSSDLRTNILGGIGSIGGDWIQIQSSIPLVMQSYTYACGGSIPNLSKSGYIVGSNDNSTWYPIQSWTMTTNPLNTGYSTCTSYITVNQSGVQTIQGNITGSGTFTAYPTTTNAYTYFRYIYTSLWGASGVAEMGEWFINFAKGDNKTAYVVSSAPSGVSSSYTNPTLASINANIVGTACSTTGQYQVIVTAGATNNVYYSMDYGVTFIGMSVGLSAMVSCTMSDDGSTITATNATTVYTITKGNIATLSIAPFVAMPLSSNLIDSLSGLSSITQVGSVSYSTIGGKVAAYFANTAMGPQANRVYGTSATPFSSMTGWSISCSFNITQLPSEYFSTVWGVGNSNCGIFLSILSTGNVEFIWYTSGNVQKKIISSAVVSINTWYNVVVAFSNNGSVNAYLNGTNFGTVTNNNLGYLTGSSSIVSFGGDTRSNITVFGYKGYISDIKIYNGVLSSADVTLLVSPPSSSASDVYAVVLADSFNCASDLNLKKDIVPLNNVLDKLDGMRGVYHDWIDENQPQVRQVGVIAQEVQAVYPELVNVGGDGHLSVNYPKLTAVLLESVKELKAKVMDHIQKRMDNAAAAAATEM